MLLESKDAQDDVLTEGDGMLLCEAAVDAWQPCQDPRNCQPTICGCKVDQPFPLGSVDYFHTQLEWHGPEKDRLLLACFGLEAALRCWGVVLATSAHEILLADHGFFV